MDTNLAILDKYEDMAYHTKKYFKGWIGKVGGWGNWVEKVVIEERTCEKLGSADPIPYISTPTNNFWYTPVYQTWMDQGDETWEDLTGS